MTQALAVQQMGSLRSMLAKMTNQLQQALPKGMVASRMVRVALTTVQRNPKLLECTPRSVIGAIVESCQLGLSLDNNLGHAYMVPYRNKGMMEAQLQIGYKGLMLLAFRSGNIVVDAGVYHEKDWMEYQEGTQPFLNFRPAVADRGKPKGAWAVARIPLGKEVLVKFKVVTEEEIMKAKAHSHGTDRSDSPWKEHWQDMWMKTAVRRLAKMLPMSGDFHAAAAMDEMAEAGVSQGLSASADAMAAEIDISLVSEAAQDELKQKLAAAQKNEESKPAKKAPGRPRKASKAKGKQDPQKSSPQPAPAQQSGKEAGSQAENGLTSKDINFGGKDSKKDKDLPF